MTTALPYLTRNSLPPDFGWRAVVDALEAAHRRKRARITDQFLKRGEETCVNRAAWIDGLGIGIKTFTVFPGNVAAGRPSVQGAMLVFDDATGAPVAVLDSGLVTWWKTAADSVLGASLLARPESRVLLVVGTGLVAGSLIEAYPVMFPGLERVLVWGRDPGKASALAERRGGEGPVVEAVADLAEAAAAADIIATATMSRTPVLCGDWVRPGTHVDLIGAFRADMREADDALLRRARLFVDSFETTLEHIGELRIPLEEGTIRREDVLGDLYDLVDGGAGRAESEEITVFKNGGGAHLDLMTAHALLAAHR